MVSALPYNNILLKESTLVYELKSNNLKAFNSLYSAYLPAIRMAIKKIIGCSLPIEDVVQNAFIKIWVNICTYEQNKGSLYTWMISIARNEAIDYLRSKHAKYARLTVPVFDVEIKQNITLNSRLDYKDLLRCFYILPPKDRQILELYSLGFTCREIGNKMGLPQGSVKTRMRMSYRKLRFYLAGLD